jgi:hypothetical protein
MKPDAAHVPAAPIQGQVLRRTERREVAILLRDDALWIADFLDGCGELVDAVTWFRFNCAGTAVSAAERRMLLESATPLSAELAAKIDALLRSPRAAEAGSDSQTRC